MGSGTSTASERRDRAAASVRARAAACALAAATLGGCASVDPALVRAERQAAMERWSSCVDRHAGLGATSLEAIEVTRAGCDGYRRDVTLTYAPHLARRVAARLDAGERRRVVDERLSRAAANAEPLSARDRVRERMDEWLSRTADAQGDG